MRYFNSDKEMKEWLAKGRQTQDIISWMVDEPTRSIRDAARWFCVPKSTIWDRIQAFEEFEADDWKDGENKYEELKQILRRRRPKWMK